MTTSNWRGNGESSTSILAPLGPNPEQRRGDDDLPEGRFRPTPIRREVGVRLFCLRKNVCLPASAGEFRRNQRTKQPASAVSYADAERPPVARSCSAA